MDTSKQPWIAYTIVEGKNGKKFWHRVGAAWLNKDGSWNINLESLPTNGTLQIREKREWPEDRAMGGGSSHHEERVEA